MLLFFSPSEQLLSGFFFLFFLPFFHVFSFLSSCLSLCGIQQFQCPVVSPHCFSPETPVWTLNCRLAGINTWMSWLQLFSFSFPSSYFLWHFHRISVKSFPLVTIGPPLLDSDIMNCHGHWIDVIIKVVAEFLYLLSQSWYYKYIFLLLSMTSMLWEIPNMTESDLSSSCFFFLSCSASDRGLTGNCYCDGCQVPSCGQALTFASFGYTSCQLMDSKCTDTNST